MAVACGGTGGHIFPGLATAQILEARGHRVTLWLAGKDIEAPAVANWGGALVTVPAQGLPSGVSVRALTAGLRLLRAARICRRTMRPDRPDVLLAMGSYASVGPVLAARRLGVPVVLHEANVVPGRAITWLSRRADALAASFEETLYHLRRPGLKVTGMPIRKALAQAARAVPIEGLEGSFTVLVTGGSRGARRLNDLVSEALVAVARDVPGLRVIHLTGFDDEAKVKARYGEAGVAAEVAAFRPDMETLYARAQFAVCRAGASTCAEITAFGLPALLVPYPSAVRNHQTFNARALERSGAANMAAEEDLTASWLSGYLLDMVHHPEKRRRMQDALLRRRGQADGAEALASLVESAAAGRPR